MNIAEIAKLAGVSSAAVSRYFNNGYISEEKRERIRKVVEETRYRPSLQAQTLRTRKTRLIGVILPKIDSAAAMGSVVAGILSVINDNGYHMLLADTQSDPGKELEYLVFFNEKQVDGVILVATVFTNGHKKALKEMTVPVVIVGQTLPGYHCVYHDDYHAFYDMTRLLLEKGRRHLGYVGVFHHDRAVGLERYQGYIDAVKDQGLEELRHALHGRLVLRLKVSLQMQAQAALLPAQVQVDLLSAGHQKGVAQLGDHPVHPAAGAVHVLFHFDQSSSGSGDMALMMGISRMHTSPAAKPLLYRFIPPWRMLVFCTMVIWMNPAARPQPHPN